MNKIKLCSLSFLTGCLFFILTAFAETIVEDNGIQVTILQSGYSGEAFADEPDVYHLDFDANGLLYVGHDNDTVSKFNTLGKREVFKSNIYDPDGVVTDLMGSLSSCGSDAGNIIVGSSGNILVFEENGTLVKTIGGGSNIQGMTFDDSQRLLVADHNNQRIATVNLDDCTLMDFISFGTSYFPGDVTVSGNKLYVTDVWGDNGVTVHDLSTNPATVVNSISGFSNPEGIAFDHVGMLGGDIFVTERGSGVVSRINPDTLNREVFATGFNQPSGITVGNDGCLYVGDMGTGKIWRFCSSTVNVDIKPNSDKNSINVCSKGTIPVAIFGAETFNVYDISTSTLTFAEARVKVVGKKDPASLCSTEYVNDDAWTDLICHFVTIDLNSLDGTSSTATVNGELIGGAVFSGIDSVYIVKDNCD